MGVKLGLSPEGRTDWGLSEQSAKNIWTQQRGVPGGWIKLHNYVLHYYPTFLTKESEAYVTTNLPVCSSVSHVSF
jgi:hypothetical protein